VQYLYPEITILPDEITEKDIGLWVISSGKMVISRKTVCIAL
jgi:hypothetical protein